MPSTDPAGAPRACRWLAIAAAIVFLALAWSVCSGGVSGFDLAWMRAMPAWHGPLLDPAMRLLSALGYAWGVIPADLALIVWLMLRRRGPQAGFALVAIAGSAALNKIVKLGIARERPALWSALAPEHSHSFPSAHAMGSMTLAAVLVVLAWPTRWRWPVTLALVAFVAGVGFSRTYLGVHWPSDVLGGWAAAVAWTAMAAWLWRPQRGR